MFYIYIQLQEERVKGSKLHRNIEKRLVEIRKINSR